MALTTAGQPLRFMDFPGEIRNECYKLLLYIPNVIEISYQKSVHDYQAIQKGGRPKMFNQTYLSLLFVNKAITTEARHFLYSQNTVAINIHIAYTSADPMTGRDRDYLFKRQDKLYRHPREKGLITPAHFCQIGHIEINLIYLTRPAKDYPNTFRPFIVKKILHILRLGDGDGTSTNNENVVAPREGKTLKVTHRPADYEIGKEWSGRQTFLQRELMKDIDPLLADVRKRRVVNIPDVPGLAKWV